MLNDPREIISEVYEDLKMEEVVMFDDEFEAAMDREFSRCEREWLSEPNTDHALCDDADCEECYNEDGDCIHPEYYMYDPDDYHPEDDWETE